MHMFVQLQPPACLIEIFVIIGVLSYFEKFLSHSIDLVKQYAASFGGSRVVAKQVTRVDRHLFPISSSSSNWPITLRYFTSPQAKFPLSECHSLRVSHRAHCVFFPNLFHSQIICLCVCLFVCLFVCLN